MKKFVILVLT